MRQVAPTLTDSGLGRAAIVRALVEAGGNRVRAAGILGIARSSLYRKIDAYGIRPLE